MTRGLRNEEWKDVHGYEGLYCVSSNGEVYSIISHKMLKPHSHQRGYVEYRLVKDGVQKTFKAHRLVAIAFIPRIEGKNEVDHINGIKHDNRACNLRWCTGMENSNYSIARLNQRIALNNMNDETRKNLRQGRSLRMVGNNIAAKKVCLSMLDNAKFFNSAKEAAEYLGVSTALVTNVCRGKGRNKSVKGYKCKYVV